MENVDSPRNPAALKVLSPKIRRSKTMRRLMLIRGCLAVDIDEPSLGGEAGECSVG